MGSREPKGEIVLVTKEGKELKIVPTQGAQLNEPNHLGGKGNE